MKRIVLMATVFLFVFLGFAYAAEQIVFVDIARAFEEYKKTTDLDEQLKSKKTERDDLVAELKKLSEGMDLLNDKAKQERQKELAAKEKKLQEVSENLLRERDEMARGILKEIETIIGDYSKKHGHMLVVNDRILLYGDKKLDITDDIIKQLNSQYKKD